MLTSGYRQLLGLGVGLILFSWGSMKSCTKPGSPAAEEDAAHVFGGGCFDTNIASYCNNQISKGGGKYELCPGQTKLKILSGFAGDTQSLNAASCQVACGETCGSYTASYVDCNGDKQSLDE